MLLSIFAHQTKPNRTNYEPFLNISNSVTGEFDFVPFLYVKFAHLNSPFHSLHYYCDIDDKNKNNDGSSTTCSDENDLMAIGSIRFPTTDQGILLKCSSYVPFLYH
jgi:hypothetical protein